MDTQCDYMALVVRSHDQDLLTCSSSALGFLLPVGGISILDSNPEIVYVTRHCRKCTLLKKD